MNVATNIGREFLQILSRNFPANHKYHKIFNKNTVKISYSCMPNMNSVIKSHNSKLLENTKENQVSVKEVKSCNCRKPTAAPRVHWVATASQIV